MKTTVELPDVLVREAQEIARKERTTLKALLEQGLRTVLAQRSQQPGNRFRLRDASVAGNGLTPQFRDAGWERIRDAAYSDL
jgi:hypothetical protein